MKNWKKLSAPVLIFALVPFLLLGACQTGPGTSSPEVVSEVAKEKDATACEVFAPPEMTDEQIDALSDDAVNTLELWVELGIGYGCA